MKTIITIFGTRPEAIKFAPVIHAVAQRGMRSVNVCSSQHTDLLKPFLSELKIPVDYDLNIMRDRQSPSSVLARIIERLNPILEQEKPAMVLVQGDTSTTLAGAMAASLARIPVGHVEAGLRTGNKNSPFPEELNRRLVSQVADLHFCATRQNMRTLIDEGIDPVTVFHTGNPVVDSLKHILATSSPSAALSTLLESVADKRILVFTSHRRENFGQTMREHMRAVRDFCNSHPDTVVIFPVHPNPAVREAADLEMANHERIHLIQPLEYADFIHLMSCAWLIASDSGGLVEEIPTLGKHALILRDTTERNEAISCGAAKLVGRSGKQLRKMLEKASSDKDWLSTPVHFNPFGNGDAGQQIADQIKNHLSLTSHSETTKGITSSLWKNVENHTRTTRL